MRQKRQLGTQAYRCWTGGRGDRSSLAFLVHTISTRAEVPKTKTQVGCATFLQVDKARNAKPQHLCAGTIHQVALEGLGSGMLGDVSVRRKVVSSAAIAGVDSIEWTVVFLSKLGGSSTLSTDVSSVIKEDFSASVEENVAHLVTGWTPLMDSSLKGSVVLNATADASYEQVEVRYPHNEKTLVQSSWNIPMPYGRAVVPFLEPVAIAIAVVCRCCCCCSCDHGRISVACRHLYRPAEVLKICFPITLDLVI